MKQILNLIILCACIAILSLASCSDSEKRLSPLLNQTKVIIDLGLPPVHAANESTIWDKIRSFFVRDAIAQSAPAAFGSILVRVSGPDIGIIEQSFGPLGTLTLNVPSGSFRQFEVFAYVAPGSPSAAASFSGAAIANLPAGDTVTVPVYMTLNETKIVVPDGGNWIITSDTGLIMMDDMNGTNWIHKINSDFTPALAGDLSPYDISYDSRGRIYIANNSPEGVIRMDDINGTNIVVGDQSHFGTGTAAVPYVLTITVDRLNNLVYFVNNAYQLYRSNLDGTSTTQLTFNTADIQYIYGIDVDPEGMLFMVGYNNTIIRYNPSTQSTIAGPYTTSLSNPRDVLVRGPYIYIANSGSTTAQIIQLQLIDNSIWVPVSEFGTHVFTPDTTSPNFYGAYRFLAIRNDLIIADSGNYNKLVSINPNPLGSGWIGWGQKANIYAIPPLTPDTPGYFYLYSTC